MRYKFLVAIFAFASFLGCKKNDYQSKEFYKQEVYIINSESTSATERIISDFPAFTFVDTIKYLNAQYDSRLIVNDKDTSVDVKFKVGVGGSLPAAEDMSVFLVLNPKAVDDYNTTKNTTKAIPDLSLYTPSVPYDAVKKGFTVVIPKGSSSTSLIFRVPIQRAKLATYKDFAFALKIVSTDKAELSRQFTEFLVAGLIVGTDKTVNWSGLPIPKIPSGRYLSVQVQGNAAENTPDGRSRKYKFITPLSDVPNAQLDGKYTIWGTSAWSWEVYGFHPIGWMYNVLTLVDKNFGLYKMEPVLGGSTDYPAQTFNYATTQQPTFDNTYDPRAKVLTVKYKNVIGNTYTDVLTFVDSDLTMDPGPWNEAPKSWAQVRARGYKYWLPL